MVRSVDYVYNRHAWVRKSEKKVVCSDCGNERYICSLNWNQKQELLRDGKVHDILCCSCGKRIKEGDAVHSKVQRKGGLVYAKAKGGKYSNLYHEKCWERTYVA